MRGGERCVPRLCVGRCVLERSCSRVRGRTGEETNGWLFGLSPTMGEEREYVATHKACSCPRSDGALGPLRSAKTHKVEHDNRRPRSRPECPTSRFLTCASVTTVTFILKYMQYTTCDSTQDKMVAEKVFERRQRAQAKRGTVRKVYWGLMNWWEQGQQEKQPG